MRNPEDLGLTGREWASLLDIMQGHLWTMGLSIADELITCIEDARGKCEAHGVSPFALVQKLEGLAGDDFETIRAVVDGFWEMTTSGSSDPKRRPAFKPTVRFGPFGA